MISVAPIDNTSLVCDPSWVSNAFEQAERLISHSRAKKIVHNFVWNRTTYFKCPKKYEKANDEKNHPHQCQSWKVIPVKEILKISALNI